MRNNLPLTGNERSFDASQRLISATDASGKILYCNNEFEAISGFNRDELVGSPHNIVRHPDMPPSVYAHMWLCLKAEKSWMGIVKNRCKNGDHYWVEAYITPTFDNGRLTGYESVRTKPSRERITRAAELYASINSGKLTSPAVLALKSAFLELWTPTVVGVVAAAAALAAGATLAGASIPLISAVIAGVMASRQFKGRIRAAMGRFLTLSTVK